MKINVKEFFDQDTATLTYVVWDENTRDAVVIDPVQNYDQAASKVSEKSAQGVIQFLRARQLQPYFILETHAHADHFSGAPLVKKEFPKAQVAIGAKIMDVQKIFKAILELPEEFKTDGSQFDRLLADGEQFNAGSLTIQTIATPGHTPACVSYLIGNHLFVGDALFMPDYGTGRCDFPGGSSTALYHSVHERLYELPGETKMYTGHDYQPNGRALQFTATIAQQKAQNIQLKAQTTIEEFVQFRSERDGSLSAPKLLWPSIQVNIDAGRLPAPSGNGKRYLKIPLN